MCVLVNSSMVTEKFGSPGINPVITGVVYADAADGSANDDDFYSIGEQIVSGTVTATNVSSGATYATNIGVSGGYAIQVGAGTYRVVATDGATGASYLVSNVVVGSDNVKVDFETTTASGAVNQPPTLQPIPDIQVVLTQSNVTTSLAAHDPDSSQLTYSATVENLAYYLDQTLVLSTNANRPDNWGGLEEKWLQGENGTWYYLTPSGQLFAWDGSGPGNLSGALVATLDRSYYADVSLLHSAQPGMSGVVATVNGTNVHLAMDSSVRGTFVVIAAVSDGQAIDTEAFFVTKGFRLVHHNPSQDSGISVISTARQQADVGNAWQGDLVLRSFPDLAADRFGRWHENAIGLGRPFTRTFRMDRHDASWSVWRGSPDNVAEQRDAGIIHRHNGDALAWMHSTSVDVLNDDEHSADASFGTPTIGKETMPSDALRLLDDLFASWQ